MYFSTVDIFIFAVSLLEGDDTKCPMCAEKVTINSLKAVPDPTIYLRGDLTVPEVPDTL